MNEPHLLDVPPVPLEYEPRPVDPKRVWPLVASGFGMILFMASATTPFLFYAGPWVLPAGVASLVLGGVLIAVADRY